MAREIAAECDEALEPFSAAHVAAASAPLPAEPTVIEPASESDWTRFIWARRSLDQIVRAEFKNEGLAR